MLNPKDIASIKGNIKDIKNPIKGIKASIIEQEIDGLKETDYEQKVIDKLINGKFT